MRGRLLPLLRSRSSLATGWGAVTLALTLIVGVITARMLGPDFRGTLAVGITAASLVVLIGALGTNVAIRRRLPRGEATDGGYLRVSALLQVPLVIVIGAADLLLAVLVDPRFFEPSIAAAFLFTGIAYFWSNQFLDLQRAHGLPVVAARTNAIGTFACLVSVVVVAWLGIGVAGIIAAYGAGWVVQTLVGWLAVRRTWAPGVAAGAGVALLGDGVRMLGLNLGQVIAYRGDAIILGALSTSRDVGYYSVATSPASVLRLPSTAIGQVLFHDVAAGRVGKRHVWLRVLQAELAIVPLIVIGWLVADWIIPLLFGEDFRAAVDVFRVLLLGELLLAPFLILGKVLVGRGGRWSASLSGVTGAIVLVGLCFALIPSWGVLGAAWSSVIAYASMSAVAASRFLLIREEPVSSTPDDDEESDVPI
jgi:O-antigen/teichoic acid export membrane protein